MKIFEEADAKLLPGFERQIVEVDGNHVLVLIKGEGPPLLMLHGDPQTHLCWHQIAPSLTDKFTVVLADIRGRGETHKPVHMADRNAYSKRDMAAEQVAVMRALGYRTFTLVGHDRGARVARRLALDHQNVVTQLVVMDIIPAIDFYENINTQIAQDYFYFSFLTQDFPVPDLMISENPEAFMRFILFGLSDQVVQYDPLALEAYLTASTTPEAVTAMCECFRAGYHIDRQHDETDRKIGNKISCPTLVMWGENGVVGKHFDVRSIWQSSCSQPEFAPMPSGHFIPEEAPDAALIALKEFLVLPEQ